MKERELKKKRERKVKIILVYNKYMNITIVDIIGEFLLLCK